MKGSALPEGACVVVDVVVVPADSCAEAEKEKEKKNHDNNMNVNHCSEPISVKGIISTQTEGMGRKQEPFCKAAV